MQELNLLAGPAVGTEGKISNPALGDTLNSMLFNLPTLFFSSLISKGVGLAFVIGAIIFFFMFVIGAIQWIGSGGDKQALESARGRISNALIGLVLLFISFAIIKLIETFFGINILTIDIGPLIIQ